MKKYLIYFLVFIYFVLCSFYVTYPLILHLNDYVFGYGDELLIAWILNWNIYSFTHSPLSIFNAPFYHPYENTLAFSDTHFTTSIFSTVTRFFTDTPVSAYNFSVIFSLITLGFFTYLLVKYMSNSHSSGIISGTLVSFSTFTLQRIVHLQVVSIQWIPLCLLFFFIFLQKKQVRYLWISMLFFLLQVSNSFLPGYFIVFSITVIFLYYFFTNKKMLRVFLNKQVVFIGLFAVGFVGFLAYPYYQVSHQFNYVRDIRDTINFANRPEYVLYPNEKTRLAPWLSSLYENDTNKLTYDGYLGGVLSVLSLTAMGFYLSRFRKPKDKESPGFPIESGMTKKQKQSLINVYTHFSIFTIIAVGSFLLSLGPVLQWGGKVIKFPFMVPLPYALLYYILPGFNGLRNSSRWEMLTVFSLSISIGLLCSYFFIKRKNWIKVVISTVICLGILSEFAYPIAYKPIETFHEFPPVYKYLQTVSDEGVILEMPFYNWNMSPYAFNENRRIYYSSLYFKKRMNGGSGFSPPEWQNRTLDFMFSFPNSETVNYLKTNKVTHLVMHKKEYDDFKIKNYTVMDKKVQYWDDIQKGLKKFPEIVLERQFGEVYVYRVNDK